MQAPEVKIGERTVGPGHPTYVIAEIGSNHDGRLDRGLAMIEMAAVAGADAVKFQSFTAAGIVARRIPDHEGELAPNPVFPFLEKLQVPEEWHYKLQSCAREAGVDFLSAPFDLERLELLDQLDVPAIKIASGDLTYEPLIRAAARTGRPILLSTGMATFDEIERTVRTIREEGNLQIVVLHCVTSYPTRLEDANVRAVQQLAKKFELPVGLSDHSSGVAAPLAAVALGACVVERHLTFSRSLSGPDHPYAMEPQEFRRMVEEIRHVEKVLGTGLKQPTGIEAEERLVGRRSIRAAVNITRGTTLTAEHLKFVRPGGGLDPFDYPKLIGKCVSHDLKEDEMIGWHDFEECD